MEQYLDTIIGALVPVIIAVFTYVKAHIDNKRLKERLDNIVDVLHSEENQYFVKCPNCGEKILLAEVTIYSDKRSKNNEN